MSHDWKMAAWRYQESEYWGAIAAAEEALGFDPLDSPGLSLVACLELHSERRTRRLGASLRHAWQAFLSDECN